MLQGMFKTNIGKESVDVTSEHAQHLDTVKIDPNSEVDPFKGVINNQTSSNDEKSSSQAAHSTINHQSQGLQAKGRKVCMCGK